MVIQSHGSDAIAHHAANAAAIAIPVGSILLRAPEILSIVLSIVGLAWYSVLFYDRFIKAKPHAKPKNKAD